MFRHLHSFTRHFIACHLALPAILAQAKDDLESRVWFDLEKLLYHFSVWDAIIGAGLLLTALALLFVCFLLTRKRDDNQHGSGHAGRSFAGREVHTQETITDKPSQSDVPLREPTNEPAKMRLAPPKPPRGWDKIEGGDESELTDGQQ